MVGNPSTKIIVVDDNTDNRNKVISSLGSSDYSCFAADNMDSAIDILEREPIKLVIFILNDKEQDSRKIIEEIKKKKTDVGVIMVTDSEVYQNVFDASKSFPDNILFKPVDLNKLPYVLAYTIEKHKINLHNREHIKDIERTLENSTKELDKFNEVLEQNFIDTIKTFVGLLETRDQHLGSHCKRVATFSRALCEQYDLKERVKRDIEIGALLHDIGKMGISDQILMKTQSFFSKTQLTLKERSIYQKHPIIGSEAVGMMNMLSNVGDYIKYHHERFDGTGYPDGLTGFYIPLGARIISVADAYEKIVFGVDKKKQSEAEILFLRFLTKHKGKIFDPEASDNMIAYIKEIKTKEYSKEKRVSISDLTPGMILARDLYSKSGVLVISQYEKVTGNDVERISRFLTSDMIIDSIYIYETTEKSRQAKKKISKVSAVNGKSDVGVLNFEKVCKAIDSVMEIRTLPEVHNSIMKFISDTKSTKEDIANILKRDPVIALTVLRFANSPLFGFSNKVTTVEEACSILGYNETRNIVTAVKAFEEEDYESNIFNRKAFWNHMVGCGCVCKIIAKHIDAKTIDEYYTAGLLHDIGKLIADQLFPDQYRKVIQKVTKESIFYRKAERLVFGQTHVEIGEYFLNHWKIPDIIIDAVRNHHSPMDSKIDPVLASAVHLSDIIAHFLHIGESGEKAVPKLEGFAEQKLGITLSNLEVLLPEIDEELKQSQEILFR